jgi:beta-galactosidase/beta-glucuronidase
MEAGSSTLTTPWTGQVRADNPLPEYPRPQMVRAHWANLNGLWDYAIQPKGHPRPSAFTGSILVPFALESSLSGVRKPLTPEQRLWYRRTFKAPAHKNQRLLIHFGAVDWEAEVFVNGVSVGKHQGGYDPFTFDITDALKPGPVQQEIVVSAWDPTDTSLHPRGKQSLDPKSIWYTAVSGIWQTVWLEPVPASYIAHLVLTPDLSGKRLQISVASSSPGDFTAVAKLHGKTVGRVSGKTGADTSLSLSRIEPWSPDAPTLYDLEVKLDSGDSVKSYFGMRSVAVAKDAAGLNRIFLNGKPLFLIGPLDQGWWPDGLYTPPTDAAIEFDIRTLKNMGFNMLRKHVKVEPARYYYWCDKLGIAIWQDMPSAMTADRASGVKKNSPTDAIFPPQAAGDFRRELQALVSNLRNSPSIIAWVPFNEGWGEHDTNDILRWVKSIDPSRLVDGPSGWEDRGYGDLKDMHSYPGPEMFPVMTDRASVLGEFGGLGYPVENHLWWTDRRNWGYRTYKTQAELESAYEQLLLKLGPLVKSGLAAAIYTQTSDVEGEVNGLVTYDRKLIKFDSKKLAQMHRELINSIRGGQHKDE